MTSCEDLGDTECTISTSSECDKLVFWDDGQWSNTDACYVDCKNCCTFDSHDPSDGGGCFPKEGLAAPDDGEHASICDKLDIHAQVLKKAMGSGYDDDINNVKNGLNDLCDKCLSLDSISAPTDVMDLCNAIHSQHSTTTTN